MLKNPYIPKIPGDKPAALPKLWNDRYVQIDENFSDLDNRNVRVIEELSAARGGRISLEARLIAMEAIAAVEYIPDDDAIPEHSHSDIYALIDHLHEGLYAPAEHNHDTNYAASGHLHDDLYADINHNHDDLYALASHRHYTSDFTGEDLIFPLGGWERTGSNVNEKPSQGRIMAGRLYASKVILGGGYSCLYSTNPAIVRPFGFFSAANVFRQVFAAAWSGAAYTMYSAESNPNALGVNWSLITTSSSSEWTRVSAGTLRIYLFDKTYSKFYQVQQSCFVHVFTSSPNIVGTYSFDFTNYYLYVYLRDLTSNQLVDSSFMMYLGGTELLTNTWTREENDASDVKHYR